MMTAVLTLAETAAQHDPMVSGAWVTGFVVAVLGAVGTLLGYNKGRKSKTEVEPTPLPVSIVSQLATKEEMRELEGRLVTEIKKLETAVGGERGVARIANGNLHARIDKVSEGLAATTATMNQINVSLNRVLDLLVAPSTPAKPNPRRTP
jgi:hypothetical protein